MDSLKEPETIERTDVAQKLMRVNTRLHFGTLSGVIGVLKDPGNPRSLFSFDAKCDLPDKDKYHPVGPTSKLTTPDDPYIIYDGGAAFCTVLLGLDRQGNALSFHRSLWVQNNEGLKMWLDLYKQALGRFVAREGLVIVSGTNLQGDGDLGIEKDEFLKQLSAMLSVGQQVFLVSRQSDNQTIYEFIPGVVNPIRGLVFIPSQLTTGGRNECFILNNDTEEREIRKFLRVNK